MHINQRPLNIIKSYTKDLYKILIMQYIFHELERLEY